MYNLLLFSLILAANSLAIIGFNRACAFSVDENNNVEDDKMIFWRIGLWCENAFGSFWSKPIYSCPTCMASVHGFIPFWFTYLTMFTLSPMAVCYWIFYTLVLSGLTTLINK